MLNRRINDAPDAPATTAQEEVKKNAAAAVAATEPAAALNDLGFKSDKIALISPLGDPSREDVTPRKGPNGQEEKITTSTIVGYLFKALEDLDVPECGMGDDARKNPMSFKDIGGSKHVKAGETFALTRFETGLLLSRPEYNARINGGGNEFTVVYQKAANVPKSADGSAAQIDSGRLPTVQLRGVTTSVKDLPMVDVMTFERQQVKDSKGNIRNQIVNRKVVPGYEKFEPLCRTLTRQPGTGAASADTKTRNPHAQAFLAMVKKAAAKG